ncbi:MAG: alpha/beta hydrolase [Acidobacteriota bacterium]
MADTTNLTLRLRDGRQLGYRTLGDPSGRPVLFFHGIPGSRWVLGDRDELVQLPGVHWILPERPGYGLSDPRPGRSVLDCAEDVEQLADHLGLERFVVAGVSGGGPHALACGHRLGERLDAILLFASPAPTDVPGAMKGMAWGNRIGIWLSRWVPGLLRRLTASQRRAFLEDPEGYVRALTGQMSESDARTLVDPVVLAAVVKDFQEAFRQGSDATFEDGQLAMSAGSWGFDLAEIHTPVYLWHGEADTLAPVTMGRALAQALPRCEADFIPDVGHLITEASEVVGQVEEVLSGL